MGKPAARMGDTTAHGGSIILGNPMVMIGKMPASAMGDMHVCPMCTGPVPHVGGPIMLGSMGVLVGKKPAARLSDMATCVGPPSMPIMGCMTVLIGEVGSGSQAGSAGSAAAAIAAKAKGPKAIEPFPLTEPPKAGPTIHTVSCEFLDSSNKPVSGVHYILKDPNSTKYVGASSSDGNAFYDGFAKKGSFEIEIPMLSEVKWSKSQISSKDKVKFSVKADGFTDGAEAMVTILEVAGANRRMLEFLPFKVKGGKIEGEWQWKNSYLPTEPTQVIQPSPQYFFQIVVGFVVAVSEPLIISDTLKIKVEEKKRQPGKDWHYNLTLPNGEMVAGVIDATATVTRQNVTPGRHRFELIDPKHEEREKAKAEQKAKEKQSEKGRQKQEEEESEKTVEDSQTDEANEFKGAIYYSPVAQEYLMIDTHEKFKAFSTSIEKSHAIRGKTQTAWEIKNAKERTEELEKIGKEWNKLFEGKVVASTDTDIEELILVQSHKKWGKTSEFVHIVKEWRANAKLIPGRWAKHSDKSLMKSLNALLKNAKSDSEEKETEPGKSLTNPNLKWSLFESEPKSGVLWKWHPLEVKRDKNDRFEFSSESAMGRYVRGYKGEAELAPFSGKVSLKASGDASFSLFEGKWAGQFYMPHRKGIDLIDLLCNEKAKNACTDKKGECCLRLTIKHSVSIFAGLSVAGSISFPAIDISKDLKKDKTKPKTKPENKLTMDAKVETEASAMAGVQGKSELVLVPEWSAESEGEFKALGEIGGELGVTVGGALKLSFKISYENGRFHYHFKAAAAWGLGGDAGWKFEVDVKEGYKLIHHLMKSTEFHYLVEIEKAAFTAYKDYAFALAVESAETLKLGAIAAMAKVHHFEHWLEERKKEIAQLGEKVKGNSLREVMYQKMPPEALGQAILTVILTREEKDFDTIIDILKASESQHETKWLLRNVGKIKMEGKDSPHFEKEKERALKAGIKKIEDFGNGVGYLKPDGSAADRNEKFLEHLTKIVNT